MQDQKTLEFIEKSKTFHGNKYGYDKTNYINSKQKLIITCKEHGDFEQQAIKHYNGAGCPSCRGRNLDCIKEDFINKIKKLLGDKCDFSKTEYKSSKEKVIIIDEYGFEHKLNPLEILSGAKLTIQNVKNKNDYIKYKFNLIHKNKFDYSEVNYNGSKNTVIIKCSNNHVFEQTPTQHLKTKTCPKCYGRNKTNKEFLCELKKVHGDRFDYSEVNYTGALNNIEITCENGHKFSQGAYSHLSGRGCPYCAGNVKLTNNDFICKSIKIHGDKYDYSKINYVNGSKKIIIVCPEHGEYKQTPESHLSGSGCPYCAGNVKKEYATYEEAKLFIKNLKLKSRNEWKRYCKSGLKPDNIPLDPESYYGKK